MGNVGQILSVSSDKNPSGLLREVSLPAVIGLPPVGNQSHVLFQLGRLFLVKGPSTDPSFNHQYFFRLFGKDAPRVMPVYASLTVGADPKITLVLSQTSQPGMFFGDLNRLLEKELNSAKIGNSSPYYTNEILREIVFELQEASLLQESIPQKQNEIPFATALDAYFKAPGENDPLLLHLNLDPLGFSQAEVLYHLPTQFQEEAVDLMKAVTTIDRLTHSLRSSDEFDALAALKETIHIVVQGHSQEQQIIEESNQVFQNGELLNWNTVVERSDDVFQKYSHQSLSQAVQDYRESLLQRWKQLLYEARIYSGEETFNGNDNLPEELRWKPVAFENREQEKLYGLIISSPTQTDNAFQIVGNIRSLFDGPVTQGIRGLEKIYRDDPLSQVTLAVKGDSSLDSASFLFSFFNAGLTPPPLSNTADYLINNPDREFLMDTFAAQSQVLQDQQLTLVLAGMAFTHGESWKKLKEDFFQSDSQVDAEIDQKYAENKTDKVKGVLREFGLNVLNNLHHVDRINGMGENDLSKCVAETYDSLLHWITVDWKETGVDAKKSVQELLILKIADLLKILQNKDNKTALFKDADRYFSPEMQLGFEFKKRYETTEILFAEILKPLSVASPIFTSVDKRVQNISDVLKQAAITLKVPREMSEALSPWEAYGVALAGSPVLAQEIGKYLQMKVPQTEFLNSISPKIYELAQEPDQLKGFRDYWLHQGEALEKEVFSHLWPDQAAQFVNRLRYLVYLLTRELELVNLTKIRASMDIDEVVKNDVRQWTQNLPSGWPNADGNSSYSHGVTDLSFAPDGSLHLTQDQFLDALLGNKGNTYENALVLTQFLTDERNGYYSFFSIVEVARDSYGYPFAIPNPPGRPHKAFVIHESLNQLLLVLQDISLIAAKKLLTEKDPVQREHLKKVRQIADQVRWSLANFLTLQSAKPLWRQKWTRYEDEEMKVENIVPTEVMGHPPAMVFSSPYQETLSEVHALLSQTGQDPFSQFGPLIEENEVGSWFLETTGSTEELEEPDPSLFLAESTLRLLPSPQKTDDEDWLLGNLDLAGTSYLLGRLLERIANPFDHDQHDRELRNRLRPIPIPHLEGILHELCPSTPFEIQSPLSEGDLSWIRGFVGHLTPTEKIWVYGTIYQQLAATQREKIREQDDVYTAALQQKEIDDYVSGLTGVEAEYLLQRIKTRYTLGDPSDHLEKLASYYNDPAHINALESEKKYLRLIVPDSPDFVKFSDHEMLYAVTWVSSKLFNSPTEVAVKRLRENLGKADSHFNPDKVERFLSRLNPEQLKQFYWVNYQTALDQYQTTARLWLEANRITPNHETSKPPFLEWLTSLLDPENIKWDLLGKTEEEQIPLVQALVQELDIKLAETLGDTDKLATDADLKMDLAFTYTVEQLLAQIIGKLEKSIRDSRIEEKTRHHLEQILAIYQKIKQALREPFNKANNLERSLHSRYNTHGYSSNPKIGILFARIYSPENLLNVTSTEKRWVMSKFSPELRISLKGMRIFLEAPAEVDPDEIENLTQRYWKNFEVLKFILNDKDGLSIYDALAKQALHHLRSKQDEAFDPSLEAQISGRFGSLKTRLTSRIFELQIEEDIQNLLVLWTYPGSPKGPGALSTLLKRPEELLPDERESSQVLAQKLKADRIQLLREQLAINKLPYAIQDFFSLPLGESPSTGLTSPPQAGSRSRAKSREVKKMECQLNPHRIGSVNHKTRDKYRENLIKEIEETILVTSQFKEDLAFVPPASLSYDDLPEKISEELQNIFPAASPETAAYYGMRDQFVLKLREEATAILNSHRLEFFSLDATPLDTTLFKALPWLSVEDTNKTIRTLRRLQAVLKIVRETDKNLYDYEKRELDQLDKLFEKRSRQLLIQIELERKNETRINQGGSPPGGIK